MSLKGLEGEAVPFNFQLFVHSPGRSIYGFHFVLDPRAFYSAGVLEQITRAFAVRGIPIVHYAVSFNPKGESHGVVFADLSGRDVDVVSNILSVLRRTSHVLDVRIISPLFDGFVFDPYFFPFMVDGERAIIFFKRNYLALGKALREKIGTGYEMILYLAGYEIGRLAYKAHAKIAGKSPEKLIKINQALFIHTGDGIMKIEEYNMDKCEATLKIYDNFECELFKGSNKPQSHLVRGMMAGWFSGFFNKEVTAIETKCIAKGDPYCQFKIKPKTQ